MTTIDPNDTIPVPMRDVFDDIDDDGEYDPFSPPDIPTGKYDVIDLTDEDELECDA